MQRRLEGKTAWISGATSGIGEAAAELFAEEGASVAIVGRRMDKGERTAERIRKRGGQAMAVRCDVAFEDEVAASIGATVSKFGALDIMVNNSGMTDVRALHEYTSLQWDRVLDVNLKSMFYAFKYAYPHLRRRPRSYIVNVGSISSFVGQESTPAYTVSKHAVLGLTRSIALDYAAEGIRANCVCPGITDTPMLWEHAGTSDDAHETLRKRLERVCIGVALTPLEIAKSILYLSCEDSAGITGTTLTIDGGYLAAAEWKHPGHTRFMERT
jgi:NAD(P)-dependent dehydrogenase (short-subunit alcohol dehydrogenase family)